MNKKGVKVLYSALIFTILNVIFIAMLFGFIFIRSNDVSLPQQAYAKQIGLLIDSAKPGTTLEIDIIEILRLAEKFNYDLENSVFINEEENEIKVQVTKNNAYIFKYYNGNELDWHIDIARRKLVVEVLG